VAFHSPFFCFVRRSWVLPPRFNQMGVPIWDHSFGIMFIVPSTIVSPINRKFISKTSLLLWGLCILTIKFWVNLFDQKIYPPKNYETSKLIIFKEPICKWFFQCHQKMDSVHSAWCHKHHFVGELYPTKSTRTEMSGCFIFFMGFCIATQVLSKLSTIFLHGTCPYQL